MLGTILDRSSSEAPGSRPYTPAPPSTASLPSESAMLRAQGMVFFSQAEKISSIDFTKKIPQPQKIFAASRRFFQRKFMKMMKNEEIFGAAGEIFGS